MPAQAQLVGSDTSPGDPCTAKGAVRMTANAVGPGAYVLTCNGDGGQWVATINAELPTANEQVANKEYVDSAVAAGGIGACVDDDTALCALETSRSSDDPDFTAANIKTGINILGVTGTMDEAAPDCTNDSTVTCTLDATRSNDDIDFTSANIANGVNILGVTGTLTGGLSGPAGCANIGDLCADGTVFAGWHPITQAHLFIPTTDQGTSEWKTSTGTDDIATDSDSDGAANSAQVANSTTFPAFKLCKDLTAGGYSDWYLPSRVELYYIRSVRGTIEAGGNITNFQTSPYWSSTENGTNYAWYQVFTTGTQNYYSKTNPMVVRCVRR